MSEVLRYAAAWCLLTILPISMFVFAETPDKPAKGADKVPDAKLDLELSKFMRRKLEASSQILEGLTTEDADLIAKGAQTLADMGAGERWQVRHDVVYKQFSNEFQRSAKALVESAEKNNFDASTLRWMDVTLKCVECHKFVRGVRLVKDQ